MKLSAPVAIAALIAALTFTSSAFARTFTVTRDDDPAPAGCSSGDCSLREAVVAADGHQGPDTIDFARGLSGDTIDLTGGELLIRHRLTIDGPGAKELAISANQLSRIFHMTGGHIVISGLTVRDGRESATPTGPACPDTSAPAFTHGGGILQDAGDLELDHVKLRNNAVTSASGGIIGGGGIANIDGTLVITHSRVTQNAVDGGAISSGGGIVNCVGVVELERTTVDNSAVTSEAIGSGGGIANGEGAAHTTGRLKLKESTVELNNTSSEAIAAAGGLSTSGGPVKVDRSTINDNSATVTGGGSIADGGGVEIANAKAKFTNSTIANNIATAPNASGGGILVGGTGQELVLHSVTLADNIADGTNSSRGGNLFGAAFAKLRNTLVAKGKATTGANCDEEVESSNRNLEDDDSCGFRMRRNVKTRDLANNGGPTDTIALKRHSPAIDHAGRRNSPKRDQRGFKRDDRPDIGAFEFGAKRH
jgi:hypothetical protein